MANKQEVYYALPRATGEKDAETKRLNDQHEMFKLLLGPITSAPLRHDISDVLDLGCGTGIWCRQFAELYPSAKILGVDIASPLANSSDISAPMNCKFEKANIEDDWEFAQSQSFDYIFSRFLVVGIRDWRRLFERAYNALRPGGMIELLESGMGFFADDEEAVKFSAVAQWRDVLNEHNAAKGLDLKAPLIFDRLLQDCGFNVIQDRPIRLYMDPDVALRHGIRNGDDIAKQASADVRSMIVNVTEKVLNTDSYRALANEALKDLAENSGRRGYYLPCINKVAQKPFK